MEQQGTFSPMLIESVATMQSFLKDKLIGVSAVRT